MLIKLNSMSSRANARDPSASLRAGLHFLRRRSYQCVPRGGIPPKKAGPPGGGGGAPSASLRAGLHFLHRRSYQCIPRGGIGPKKPALGMTAFGGGFWEIKDSNP